MYKKYNLVLKNLNNYDVKSLKLLNECINENLYEIKSEIIN